jgi:methyltransferase
MPQAAVSGAVAMDADTPELDSPCFLPCGREHAPRTYHWIVALHAAWFAAMLLEVFAGRRKFRPRLAVLALSLFAAGQALRLTAIRTLGWRWSTRIMTVPEEAPVQHGIYRYLRHPNYLGVELEILAAPLIHSAYLTSAVFAAANILLLRDRIRREEQALDAYGRDNA